MMSEREQEIFIEGIRVGIRAAQTIEQYISLDDEEKEKRKMGKIAETLFGKKKGRPAGSKGKKWEKYTRGDGSIAYRKAGTTPRVKVLWTPEQDAILREKYGKISVREIAEEIGRTPSSVQSRAFNLHLSVKKDNTIGEDREGLADLNQPEE